MAEKTPPPMPQPKRGPSPMQPEMDGITSVRQFFSILFGRHKKSDK
jgi:hypothetical protein